MLQYTPTLNLICACTMPKNWGKNYHCPSMSADCVSHTLQKFCTINFTDKVCFDDMSLLAEKKIRKLCSFLYSFSANLWY